MVITLIGLALLVRPLPQLGIPSRVDAAVIVGIGVGLTAIALMLPTSEIRVTMLTSELDEFFPIWQFAERHGIEVDASPARVMDAVRNVRASEILLFRALTWIRRGGRRSPDSILDAATIDEPIIDVALRCGFAQLADVAARELVIGTVIAAPTPLRPRITTMNFGTPPTGCVVAGLNFLVTPIGTSRSRLTTETRVNAHGANVRRAFALYWRLIYPGSAFIRRMWLRAVARHAAPRGAR